MRTIGTPVDERRCPKRASLVGTRADLCARPASPSRHTTTAFIQQLKVILGIIAFIEDDR